MLVWLWVYVEKEPATKLFDCLLDSIDLVGKQILHQFGTKVMVVNEIVAAVGEAFVCGCVGFACGFTFLKGKKEGSVVFVRVPVVVVYWWWNGNWGITKVDN